MEEIKNSVEFTQPKVSIILPVFNRRHLILRAIASVQRQSS
jgi:glycosyltransferase involved in cell wall biosynthesis